MAGIKITGNFVTNDPNDTYGILEDKFLIGGHRTVDTLAERDSIPELRRKWGMLCYVKETDTVYKLIDNNGNISDNSNWVEFSSGSGSVSSVENVDDITIEYIDGYKEFSKIENDIYNILKNNWLENIPSSSYNSALVNKGTIFLSPKSDLFFEYTGDINNMPNWDAGVYEFYAPYELPDNSVYLEDEAGNQYFFTSVKDNKLYRYYVELTTSVKIVYFGVSNLIDKPFNIKLINRYSSTNEKEISIKNIDFIIDSNDLSIDDFYIESFNDKRELVTKDYVNKKLKYADEITLTQIKENIKIATYENDYQLVFKNQWNSTLPDNNWELGSSSTFSNGVFTLSFDDSDTNTYTIIKRNDSNAVFDKVTKVVLISDVDLESNNLTLLLDDDINSVYTTVYNKQSLPDGSFLYYLYIPRGFVFSELSILPNTVNNVTLTINISVVEMSSYPPKEIIKINEIDYIIDDDLYSIDSSNTPATNAHRELVTRAYVDNQISSSVKTDELTVTKQRLSKHARSGNTIYEVIKNNWNPNVSTNPSDWDFHSISDGAINCLSGMTKDIINEYHGNDIWESGIYEFYLTSRFTVVGTQVIDQDNNFINYTYSVSYEGPYTRITFNFPDPFTLKNIRIFTNEEYPCSVLLIDRLNPKFEDEITITGIDGIVKDDDITVDKFKNHKVEGLNNQLVTLDYINAKLSNADEITLEKIVENVIYREDSDYNVVFHNGWADFFPDNEWTLGPTTTYDNGTFTIDSISNSLLISHEPFVIPGNYNFRLLTNEYCNIGFNSDGTGISFSYNKVVLPNGWYLHEVYFYRNFRFSNITVWGGNATKIRIVDMVQYPPKTSFKIKNINYIIDDDLQSIDGSNTPASDAHSELVTRAYVDVNSFKAITPIVRALETTTNIDINNPPTSLIIDDVSISDGDNIALFAQTNDVENGLYTYHTDGSSASLQRHFFEDGSDIYGRTFLVAEGTHYADTLHLFTNDKPNTIVGTDNLHILMIGGRSLWKEDDDPTGYGRRLRPNNPLVKTISLKNDDNGFNSITVENANSSSNYSGSNIVLTVDNAAYTNQTFIAHHGPNYYQPHLRSRGAIMTDSSMYIGAYNATDRQGEPAFVSFIVGDDYYNQKEIFKLTTKGLEMTLVDKKFWYKAGTQVQNHPINFTQLFVNVDTTEVYAGAPLITKSVRAIELNNNIDLSNPTNPTVIDGVTLQDGDRIALFGQNDAKENGLYIVDYANGFYRAYDVNVGASIAAMIFVVEQGNENANTVWMLTNNTGSDIVGTNELYVLKIGKKYSEAFIDYFIIDDTIKSNGYVDLTYTPISNNEVDVYHNGLREDEGDFYTLSGNRITFIDVNSLYIGNKLTIKYRY